MQELPELDIYRAMLAERFAGAQLTAVTLPPHIVEKETLAALVADLMGAIIWFVERRAQHLVFHLDNGKRLLVHMPNEAYLYVSSGEPEFDAGKDAVLSFGDRYICFAGLAEGDLSLHSVKGLERIMKDSGMDPLDRRLTLAKFRERFAKKKTSLKTALLDEKLITGIGALYADEIAFAAEIRPDVKLQHLDDEAWERLYQAMGSVLRESISHGGCGEHPMFEGDILTGGFKERLQVYEREGESCSRCGETVKRIAAGNRKAYACTGCQRSFEP